MDKELINEIKVRGINPSLIFQADGTAKYTLFWSNSQIEPPVYDIEKCELPAT